MTRTLNMMPAVARNSPVCLYADTGRKLRGAQCQASQQHSTPRTWSAIFRELSQEQLTAAWSQAKVLSLTRGNALVRRWPRSWRHAIKVHRSPDGAERHPGTTVQTTTLLPDFAPLNPGYAVAISASAAAGSSRPS